MDFAVPANHRVKMKESEKEISTQTLLENWKKNIDHESDGDINCNWRARYIHQRIGTGTGQFVKNEDEWRSSKIQLC